MSKNLSAAVCFSGNKNNLSVSSSSRSHFERDDYSQWYFTAEQLFNSPSRRDGIDADQELAFRQMAAYIIQETCHRLQVSENCINTAIVYLHRFYAFHSFTKFQRDDMAVTSLFLATKVEKQRRQLVHVIEAANNCLNQPYFSTGDTTFVDQQQDLLFNENVMLQTLRLSLTIEHPHKHVIRICKLVKACQDLAQASYFLATNSLHLMTMCLQHRSTVVACFCFYLACKWVRWEISRSTEGKLWFHYINKTVTMHLLDKLTEKYLAIYEKCPARLKSKLRSPSKRTQKMLVINKVTATVYAIQMCLCRPPPTINSSSSCRHNQNLSHRLNISRPMRLMASIIAAPVVSANQIRV